ncbi:hypothetical protein Micbo1qcDRAFT_210589 [Microdochium bolleyi]|uniref:Fungal-specific transcription factor domain-domain-containing protein n=1 Tax=Microdochium bolleyi TaxID=196109 RepID=A0A136JGP5_9PEZI|nr:hypothetical protein Micbo1qcDRAFT_210589 [Microdochium bolleyi]
MTATHEKARRRGARARAQAAATAIGSTLQCAIAQAVSSASASRSFRSYAISYRVSGNQADRQLLHYFCVWLASEISGFLPSNFWTRMVLQRAQHELVVRQALVALSSLHRQMHTARSEGAACVNKQINASSESGAAYHRAMRSLRRYLRNQSGESATDTQASSAVASDIDGHQSRIVPLICCVLFYTFESVQGNVDSALEHLAAGRAILGNNKD